MGLKELQALKAPKSGSVMTAKEFQEIAKGKKFANPMAGKFHSGQYETSYGPIYFRSKWEAQYSQYLDWLKKCGEILEWKYESDVFVFDGIKKGTDSYKPDFKIFGKMPQWVEYHEVKGFMTPKARTQLKRMKKYHPNVKVVLIERKQLDEIKRNLKGLIKFY